MKYFSRNLTKNNRHSLVLITLLMSVTVISGCGEKGKSTQVAAKINSEEITISQVNSVLANVPVTPGKTAEDAKQEVLNNLIVQNLAQQQAVKLKLDRSPAVMQAIESAKNTILARAYMDPIISGIPKPTSEDVHEYYVAHPELFSDRHIYAIKELEAESKPDLAASIREMAGKGSSQEAIQAALKAKDIASSIQSGVKPAEQLPLEMLPRFAKLTPGELVVIELSKSISVLQVVNSKAEPVDEKLATATIQEYLMNSRKKEALEKEIKSLKDGAKIEYFGEFQSGVKAVATEAKSATAEASAKEKESARSADIAKGVAGLK